jgi:hypothetical protein
VSGFFSPPSREIESILSKSKLTEEQAKELADEVSLAIAKRPLEKGTVEFSSEIAKSLNFTAEHTENAEA